MDTSKPDEKEPPPSAKDNAPAEGKPDHLSHDDPAGPVNRGGSLSPNELEEEVDEASDESFPASDAPSWSPTHSS